MKRHNEIDYESTQGKRGSYSIRIRRSDWFKKPSPLQHDFNTNPPSNVEVTSTRPDTHNPANPHGQSDADVSQLQHADAPIDVATASASDVAKAPASDPAEASGEAEAGNSEIENDNGWNLGNERKTDKDPADRIAALVDQLHGADERTLPEFRREFGQLTQAEYHWVLECLRDRAPGRPVGNGAAYVRHVLRERRTRERGEAA